MENKVQTVCSGFRTAKWEMELTQEWGLQIWKMDVQSLFWKIDGAIGAKNHTHQLCIFCLIWYCFIWPLWFTIYMCIHLYIIQMLVAILFRYYLDLILYLHLYYTVIPLAIWKLKIWSPIVVATVIPSLVATPPAINPAGFGPSHPRMFFSNPRMGKKYTGRDTFFF